MHPVDPESKEKFDIRDRITVKDYYQKVTDFIYCYKIGQNLQEVQRKVRKHFNKENNIQSHIVKPESMIDLPDSDSDSMDTDEQQAKGLTITAMNLGDGATLYLQMIKTFALMFILLSIINIPIYVLYEHNTQGNVYFDFSKSFRLYTLGNLGQLSKRCSHQTMDWHFLEYYDKVKYPNKVLSNPKPPKMQFDCGEGGYIERLMDFGLTYKNDSKYHGPTNGTALCNHIMNPLDPYIFKKPIDCKKDENKEKEEC